MKSIFTQLLLTASLAFVSCNQSGGDNNNNGKTDTLPPTENNDAKAVVTTTTACVTLAGEDSIDLIPYIRLDTVATYEKAKFAHCFRYKNNTDTLELSEDPLVINMAAFLRMYQNLSGLPANITGVQIFLGLEDNRIQLFFQNVIMKCSSGSSTLEAPYQYTPVPTGDIYVLANATLVAPPSADSFSISTANYKNNILIRHTDRGYFEPMNTTNTWEHDTKSAIFSYQEIFYYYHLNYPCNGGSAYDHDLFIYPGASAKKEGEQFVKNKKPAARKKQNPATVNKQTIFIASGMVNKNGANKGQKFLVTDIANLAHLCPPSCDPIYSIRKKYPCSQ